MTFKVGDKVTLSDWMYDGDIWGSSDWVTEAYGLVGVVAAAGVDSFYIDWVGLGDKSAPNYACWNGFYLKYLGSTTE